MAAVSGLTTSHRDGEIIMTLFLSNAGNILRDAGLNVIEMPGWQDRGESDGPFNPIAIMLHHDGMGLGFNTNPNDDMNVPNYMSRNGVNGAPFWVRKDGVWVVLAAGRKWHAGIGNGWKAIPANQGNTYSAGVETDHTTGNPWPKEQLDSIHVGCRALVKAYGWDAANCCGHKEYAPGRKTDPENFDMNAWRMYLSSSGSNAGQSAGPAVPPPPAPTPTPPPVEVKPYTPPPGPWSLPAGHYYGLITGPAKSHGGYYPAERPAVQWIQVRLHELGYAPGGGWADGKYEQPTVDAVASWQRARHASTTSLPGQVWSDDWANLIKDR